MPIQIFDCEQGSPEWLAFRLGIPTASEFATVMAKGRGGGESKTRTTYMYKLAGEILGEAPAENYCNADMERGKEQEPLARAEYEDRHMIRVQQVGFIRNGDCGCSPDGLVGADGGLEIKSAAAHIQIGRALAGTLPPEHRAQVQGSMWITGRDWWDFVSFCPRMPRLEVRVERDDRYIREIAEAVACFNEELAALVERLRDMRDAA